MKLFINKHLIALLAMCILGVGCAQGANLVQSQEKVIVAQEEASEVQAPQISTEKSVSKPTEKQPQTPVKQSSAVKTPSKDYTACFSAWDTQLHTLQTLFTQNTQYDGTNISTSKGQIYYQQNGKKLRLDNLENALITQTALTDKKQIYILDDKGTEITRISWKEWLLGQPNQTLFDFGNYTQLLQKHTVQVKDLDKQFVLLVLSPKKSSENYSLYVKIDKQTCFPQTITVESDLMQTIADLSDTKINGALPKDIFKGLK